MHKNIAILGYRRNEKALRIEVPEFTDRLRVVQPDGTTHVYKKTRTCISGYDYDKADEWQEYEYKYSEQTLKVNK